ncbi:MAG: radical SAM protein [Promethearchaeota archaeon]
MPPEYIRVSIGTAVVLGLEHMKLDAIPTTAYLMLYSEKHCLANCVFCPQARESKARNDSLSRIFWPEFQVNEVKQAFESLSNDDNFERICIQTINYIGFFDDLIGMIEILSGVNTPISISVHPLKKAQLKKLKELGVSRIGIPFDAATKSIFYNTKGKGIKGPYKWKEYLKNMKLAQSIFGKHNVSTHLIVGLGETEFESIIFLQKMIDTQVLPALFTFTPIKGTAFEKKSRPTLLQYRKIQLARYLLINKICRIDDFSFNEKGELIDFYIPKEQLYEIIQTGTPFLTSGCHGCNRPYYNERPSENPYNYHRPLTNKEIKQIIKLFEEKIR